ncbi:glycosyltransferase [candidate division KSB1 bacterium]|nr:glycosyltransferase [candidate division KSB1 bacterium]
MTVFEITILILIGFYVLEALLIIIGITRLNYTRNEQKPRVSVIIVARNEEQNLGECLASISGLNYSHERMEIILIDDRSDDRTGMMMREFADRHPHVKSIRIQQNPATNISGKANAVSKGIDVSSGEIILLTDADCVLPQSWIEEYVSLFTNQVGLVAGMTLLDAAGDTTPIFGKIQSLDWAYLLTVGAGAVGLGIPLSCVGNNFGFRRQVYRDVGGFENLGFSLTEDFSFVKAIMQKTNWQIRVTMNPRILVRSKAMRDLISFYHQRKRWATGSLGVRAFGKFLIATAILTHILIPVGLFFGTGWLIATGSLAAVFMADFALLFKTCRRLKRLDLIKYFPIFELFYFGYTTLFTLVMPFSSKVKWKNIVYDIKKGPVCNECL